MKISIISRINKYYSDREALAQLYKFAAPIAFQNLITALLAMAGSVMVGQLGDAPLVAVALAGQIFFLLILVTFGIASGSAMFTAQLWGNRDIENLHKVQGLCLILGLFAALIFFIPSEFFPTQVLSIFSEDVQVIALGSEYLKIIAWAFFLFSVTSGFSAVLRSVGQVKLPMAVNVSALGLNIGLSYVLIFGKFGLPAMGIFGAAWAVVISRAAECLGLVILVYTRKLPVAASLREMTGFNLGFVDKVFKPVLPVILNELLWSLAISTYSVIYARIGTTSIAAMNIVSTVDNLSIVPFMGLSSAAAIIVGNKIGAGKKDEAYTNVGQTLGITLALSILVGGLVLLTNNLVLSFYQVSAEVIFLAHRALIVLGCFLIIRSQNMILVVGMMRSGGDSRYSLFLDGVIIWILGVPMAVLGGFILRLPVYWVYLFVMSEELVKCILGLRRYFTRKWLHDLSQTVQNPVPLEPLGMPVEPKAVE